MAETAAPIESAPAPVTLSPDGTNLPVGPNLNNAFSALDNIIGASETSEIKPDEKKVIAPNKTAKIANPDVDKPEIKPEQNGDKRDVQKPEEKPKPEKAASLREALERSKAEAKEWQRKHNEIVKGQSKPKDDPEKKQLSDRLLAAEKRAEELQERIKFLDYKEDDDYKKNYWKPYEQSYQDGRSKISNLKTIEIKNPDTGEVIQPSRQATADDFDKIMAKDDEEAAEHIERLFGTGAKANLVIAARHDTQKALGAMQRAESEFKTKGAEWRNQQSQNNTKQQQEAVQLFRSESQSGVEKYPDWFKPVEGDDKGNTMLEQGMMMADLAFGILDSEKLSQLPAWIQQKMVYGKLPRNEMISLHSAVRNMAGGFNRITHQNKALKTELAELKTKLEEYENSEPGKGEERRGESAGEGILSADEAIDRMAGLNV